MLVALTDETVAADLDLRRFSTENARRKMH
jgi:hypothetical protein